MKILLVKLFDYRYLQRLVTMEKYRILLVDDHQILLEGTKNLINSSELFEVTATANSAEKAQKLLVDSDFDILITDYQMKGMDGSELIQIAKSVLPDLKVIVLSMHDDSHIVKDLLKKGVDGYVLKSDPHDSVILALNKVTEGKRYLSDEIAELLIQGMDEEEDNTLTPREQEIVKLIVKEYSTKQIAEILFISERTVETHRKNILKKTGANNLVALINYAYKHKLV